MDIVSSPRPRLALARLPTPPPTGSIQFFDGYFPALSANSYTIVVKQHITGGPVDKSYEVTQSFAVDAPEFVIDPGIVHTMFPPAGSSHAYGQNLPFIVLTDPTLPWERSLGIEPPDPANPLPWMALLIFAAGEILLQDGTNNPVTTRSVAELIAADPDKAVLKPSLPQLPAETLASPCRTITITGAAFKALMPDITDLPLLAHCRAVGSSREGEALLSVLLCNRLAVPGTQQKKAPLRYYAHLVSLEGYRPYLGPSGQPIPAKPAGGPMDVELVSLANWTFVSLPDGGMNFAGLAQGLIASEQATPLLRLPVSDSHAAPASVLARLKDGYAPLTFVSGAGEESFAWYRGPFSPVVPKLLPRVGAPPVEARHAASADALMIYMAEEGLFDLSYAAAWNIGRELALADASFAQAMNTWRGAAQATLTRLSQRIAMPHFFGRTATPPLAESDATRAHFAGLVTAGLGAAWTATLGAVRDGGRPAPTMPHRIAPVARRPAIHPRAVISAPGVAETIIASVEDKLAAPAAWLANLSLLHPVPFSHLVPDPLMLPVESIRFFHVDQNWIDALIAGALSIAVHGSVDTVLLAAVRPRLTQLVAARRARRMGGPMGASSTADSATALTGMLIRSQLVSGWPALVVGATLGGAPLPIVRNDCPAPTVRLCLFQGAPDTVTLGEPYQGLQFGVEDSGIQPRCVTDPSRAGAQFPNVAAVAPIVRTAESGRVGGVLEVRPTAKALEAAAGVIAYAAGATVNWNGTALATTVVGESRLDAVVPAALLAAAGTAGITVVMKGVASAAAPFTVDAALAIDSLDPVFARAGKGAFALTVRGVGFAADAVVQWNGTPLATRIIGVMEAVAQVPATLIAAKGTASITVASARATSAPARFAIIGAEPAIDAIAPVVKPAGADGFTLTVTGAGFTPDASMRWNGSPLVTTIAGEGQVSASVPAALIAKTGTASISVVTTGGTSNVIQFTIAGATATIGLLRPAIAMTGGRAFTLIVDGVNFAKGDKVHWNGTALDTVFDSAEQLSATVPAAQLSATAAVSVTVVSGTGTSNALPVTLIVPRPTIGLLEPRTAVAGAPQLTLHVYGGFGAGDFALQTVRAPERQSFIPEGR